MDLGPLPNPPPRASQERRKLWELDAKLHCSVIGTCLTVEELRRLQRKIRLNLPTPVSDYQLHHGFVHLAHDAQGPARLLQKYLDRKYREQIRALRGYAQTGDLARHWQTAVQQGTVTGAYWALLTHPAATPALVELVSADVHMWAHQAVAETDARVQALDHWRRRYRHLQQRHDQLNRQANDYKKELRRVQRRAQRAEHRYQVLQAQQSKQPPAPQQITEQEIALCREQARQAEADTQRWRKRCRVLEAKLERLQHNAPDSAAAAATPPPQAAGGRDVDIEPSCLHDCAILYVGGRARQCPRLRALVEQRGGRFLYHDGGLQDGHARLAEKLQQADTVVCPIDCVSHDAYQRAKGFCKRHAKRLVLLRNASVSAFTKALDQLRAAPAADGRQS